MTEPLSDWLALREPADRTARSLALTSAVVAALPRDRPLRILDLGAGTGSNVRYLTRYLPPRQQWLLVDRDAALLAEAPRRMFSAEVADLSACHIETRCLDLGALDRPEIFDGRDLVTASALLDLVSGVWLEALAGRCLASGAMALFALTYNGRSRCSPEEPEDEIIRTLMNRHQKQNDKGFGRAAGPDAVDVAERCFAAAGYRVRRAPSDWVLTPDDRDLQRHLIEGWAEAAVEIAPDQAGTIGSWLARRLAHVDAGESCITVGHEDLAAIRN
jgi:hypothetical protein